MDERLAQALELSNYMITLSNQKRILIEQYHNDLVYYFNGGEFTASQQLISFCQSLIYLKQTETILIDNGNLPVEIESLEEFTKNIINVYFTASNKYLTEYNILKKHRTVEGIVNK